MTWDRFWTELIAFLERLGFTWTDPGVPVEPPPTTTTPPPVVIPPPVTTPPTVTTPSGPIQTKGPNGQDLGSWDDLTRWEPLFTDATRAAGNVFAPLLLGCFAIVETGANHYRTGEMTGTPEQVIVAGHGGPAGGVGILQIIPIHFRGDETPYDVEHNVYTGARLLSRWIISEGSWEAALTNRWHPGVDPKSGYTPETYISTVRKLIAEAKGIVLPDTPPPSSLLNPYPQPKIYTLERDYARFGLTAQEAVTTMGNCNVGRGGGGAIGAVVQHIQEGTTPGSLDWWLNGYVNGVKVRASSTVMTQKDGSILRVIDERNGPWTNGRVCNPTPKSAKLRGMGRDVNNHSLTNESEGYTDEPYTDAQFSAIMWQTVEWIHGYELSAADVISHASIDQCDRPNCPGNEHMLQILHELERIGIA